MAKNASAPTVQDDVASLGAEIERVDPLVDPMIKWVASATVERGVVLVPLNITGTVELSFGDGTTPTTGASGIPVHHTYAAPGAYTVSARQGENVVARAQVFVRDGLTPAVTLSAGADNPLFWDLTVNADPESMISQFEVRWGDGSAPQIVAAPKGTKVSHGYQAGDYPVTVIDRHSGRWLTQDITVSAPTYDPDFTATKGADAMTVEITLTTVGTPGKEVLVDFGDFSQEVITNGQVGAKVSHKYAAADSYLVQVVYSDGSTAGSSRLVTVPFA